MDGPFLENDITNIFELWYLHFYNRYR